MNYNVGKFGKTIQKSIYDKSEGLDLNSKKNNSERDKNMVEKKKFVPQPQETTDSKRKELVKGDYWVNKGGKALFIKIDGVEYMTSISLIQSLISGTLKDSEGKEQTGVRLSKLV